MNVKAIGFDISQYRVMLHRSTFITEATDKENLEFLILREILRKITSDPLETAHNGVDFFIDDDDLSEYIDTDASLVLEIRKLALFTMPIIWTILSDHIMMDTSDKYELLAVAGDIAVIELK